MRRFIIIFLLIVTIGQLHSQNEGVLTDPQISFTFVSKNVEGTIAGFSSSSKIDRSNLSNSKFKGSVETKTLDTGNFLRNWSLRGSKYFDVDTYPTISFESESISENDEGITVEGQLTMKGVRKPINMLFKEIDGRLIGTTALFSSDFGIEVLKKGREAHKVTVELSFLVD